MASHIEAAAHALRQARAACTPIEQISASYGVTSLDDAYAVSMLNNRRRAEQGARIVGKKVGLTSLAVQTQLGVDQPDFGLLFDDMEYLDGDEIPVCRLMQPKIEGEIAFVVGRDLVGDRPSYAEFIAALAYALPALEIVDSAISGWALTLADTVADNASCGLYVLGNQPTPIGQISLAEVGLALHCNGTLKSVGAGAACLGHPLRAAYWLARTMADRGEGLRAGEVILSGALGPMINVGADDMVYADMGPLGSVSCRMIEGMPEGALHE